MPIRWGSTPVERGKEVESLDAVPGLECQHIGVVVRRLLGILPADHAIGIDGRTHAGQMGAANLLIGSKTAERLEMAVRAQDAGTGRTGLCRSIEVAGAIKAGQGLDRHVFNRVAIVGPQAVPQDTKRSLLRQRPQSGSFQKAFS